MPCPNSARERSVTIGFRVTPEQARRIDLRARASGMKKSSRSLCALSGHTTSQKRDS